MALSLTDLNADVMSKILQYLDINSYVNLSKTSKIFKDHFREQVTRKLFLKKLQSYLINILFDCYEGGTLKEFQVFHHLCKCVLSHISHVAYNLHVLSNANQVKEKVIAELVLKSMSLPTTGLDILPPLDTEHNLHTWINHWYCFEVHDDRYIFLTSCKNIDRWYRQHKLYSKDFVSAAIHYPLSVEERTMYFACRFDPICDWNSVIQESCILSNSTDPNTYLEYIADELKEIVSGDEEKEKVTAQFLYDFVAHNSHSVEFDENVDNGYKEEDIEKIICNSIETITKSFDKFLYEISYSKCFPKVDAQYTLTIKTFFDFFVDLLGLVPYKELSDILKSLLNIFKPMQLSFFAQQLRSDRDLTLPVIKELYKRIQIDESFFSNEQELFVLYLDNGVRVEWSYINSFPFLNKLMVNNEIVLSCFYDRIEGEQPVAFPDGYDVGEDDGYSVNDKFVNLFNENGKSDLIRLRDVFTSYVYKNFVQPPEIDFEFLTSLLLSLSNCPFYMQNFKLENLTIFL